MEKRPLLNCSTQESWLICQNIKSQALGSGFSQFLKVLHFCGIAILLPNTDQEQASKDPVAKSSKKIFRDFDEVLPMKLFQMIEEHIKDQNNIF